MKKLVLLFMLSVSMFGDVVSIASKYIGGDYKWGVISPATKTFDCSGLICYAYKKMGKTLPREVRGMYKVRHSQFKVISYKDIKRGDIMLWNFHPNKQPLPSHATLYYGDGQIISSESSKVGIIKVPIFKKVKAEKIKGYMWGNNYKRKYLTCILRPL